VTAADRTLALEPGFAQRLLEELVYQHVQTQVDLFRLGCFEDELDETIRRVLDGLGADGDGPPPAVLAATLVDRAWARLEHDWKSNRGASECPCCAMEETAERRKRRGA
jgi:hypothetical protein